MQATQKEQMKESINGFSAKKEEFTLNLSKINMNDLTQIVGEKGPFYFQNSTQIANTNNDQIQNPLKESHIQLQQKQQQVQFQNEENYNCTESLPRKSCKKSDRTPFMSDIEIYVKNLDDIRPNNDLSELTFVENEKTVIQNENTNTNYPHQLANGGAGNEKLNFCPDCFSKSQEIRNLQNIIDSLNKQIFVCQKKNNESEQKILELHQQIANRQKDYQDYKISQVTLEIMQETQSKVMGQNHKLEQIFKKIIQDQKTDFSSTFANFGKTIDELMQQKSAMLQEFKFLLEKLQNEKLALIDLSTIQDNLDTLTDFKHIDQHQQQFSSRQQSDKSKTIVDYNSKSRSLSKQKSNQQLKSQNSNLQQEMTRPKSYTILSDVKNKMLNTKQKSPNLSSSQRNTSNKKDQENVYKNGSEVKLQRHFKSNNIENDDLGSDIEEITNLIQNSNQSKAHHQNNDLTNYETFNQKTHEEREKQKQLQQQETSKNNSNMKLNLKNLRNYSSENQQQEPLSTLRSHRNNSSGRNHSNSNVNKPQFIKKPIQQQQQQQQQQNRAEEFRERGGGTDRGLSNSRPQNIRINEFLEEKYTHQQQQQQQQYCQTSRTNYNSCLNSGTAATSTTTSSKGQQQQQYHQQFLQQKMQQVIGQNEAQVGQFQYKSNKNCYTNNNINCENTFDKQNLMLTGVKSPDFNQKINLENYKGTLTQRSSTAQKQRGLHHTYQKHKMINNLTNQNISSRIQPSTSKYLEEEDRAVQKVLANKSKQTNDYQQAPLSSSRNKTRSVHQNSAISNNNNNNNSSSNSNSFIESLKAKLQNQYSVQQQQNQNFNYL